MWSWQISAGAFAWTIVAQDRLWTSFSSPRFARSLIFRVNNYGAPQVTALHSPEELRGPAGSAPASHGADSVSRFYQIPPRKTVPSSEAPANRP